MRKNYFLFRTPAFEASGALAALLFILRSPTPARLLAMTLLGTLYAFDDQQILRLSESLSDTAARLRESVFAIASRVTPLLDAHFLALLEQIGGRSGLRHA